MSEGKLHRYDGADSVVTWDASVCVHAAECVRGLPEVFDPKVKPWIRPEAAHTDALAATIARCPSGALKLYRPDGALVVASGPGAIAAEPLAAATVLKPRPDGPNVMAGDFVVVIATASGVRHETQAFLCRCGASSNKPFCDGAHKKTGFKDSGLLPANAPQGSLPPGRVTITPTPDGPLECLGPLTIAGADGRTTTSSETWLCRCGGSSTKPFCDGTHARNGFRA